MMPTADLATTIIAPEAIEPRLIRRAMTTDTWLAPLLRGQASDWAPPSRIDGDPSERPGLDLSAFRGIAIALLVSVPLWVAIGMCARVILRAP